MDSLSKDSAAFLAKKKLTEAFFKKGITVAVISGMCYGLYSAFVNVAMSKGVWAEWYSEGSNLSKFVSIYVLGALGAALNDFMSAVWAWIMAARSGKISDFFRCLNSKPGRIMCLAAVIGGPLAGTAYIVALQMAGSIIIPITALCPAIGAILGKVIFKQELNARMCLGVATCVLASIMIGSSSITGAGVDTTILIGMLIALIAAFCWGLEGVVGGFGTSLIDVEIGIMIRQTVSALVNLLILVPVLGFFSKGRNGDLLGLIEVLSLSAEAFADPISLAFFVISGFFSLFAFSLWYKGNAMCGAALGMACNGAYSFWGLFFCYLILGLLFGMSSWELAPIVWIGALVMSFGILLIAVNPLELFNKKD